LIVFQYFSRIKIFPSVHLTFLNVLNYSYLMLTSSSLSISIVNVKKIISRITLMNFFFFFLFRVIKKNYFLLMRGNIFSILSHTSEKVISLLQWGDHWYFFVLKDKHTARSEPKLQKLLIN